MANDIDAMKEHFKTGMYVPFKLTDVKVRWCKHLGTPDTAFDPIGKYKVTCMLDEKTYKRMKDIGFNVKENAEGEYFCVPGRKPELGPPRVEDEKGNPVDPNTIGNDSVCTVKVKCKHMVINKTEHLPIYIEKVIVKDLQLFEGAGGDDPFEMGND